MMFSNRRSTTFLAIEPRDLLYRQLIQLARTQCATFSLVRRPNMRWSEEAANVTTELSPFLQSEQLCKQWPGTRSSRAAQIFTWALTRQSAFILEKAEGLFDWQQPHLPEDLALYTPGGELWLFSCAHEGLAEWGSAEIAAKVRLQLAGI